MADIVNVRADAPAVHGHSHAHRHGRVASGRRRISLLRMSAAARLGVALALSAIVWTAVLWVTS